MHVCMEVRDWHWMSSPMDLYLFILLLYVYECFDCACLCTACMPSAFRGQKRALELSDLKLQRNVSCRVSAEN